MRWSRQAFVVAGVGAPQIRDGFLGEVVAVRRGAGVDPGDLVKECPVALEEGDELGLNLRIDVHTPMIRRGTGNITPFPATPSKFGTSQLECLLQLKSITH